MIRNMFITALFMIALSVTAHGQTEKQQSGSRPEQMSKSSEVLKAQVTERPAPTYTKEARQNQVTGTVIIHCVFTSTAKVTHIQVISGLPYGLTERAVKAAKKIRFIPATKDGHPVSMWMELEYNFTLE